MAFGTELEIQNSGVRATYWRILRVDATFPPDTDGASVNVTLQGWVSAEARASGKAPIPEARRTETIILSDADQAEMLTKANLYQAISEAVSDFADAAFV